MKATNNSLEACFRFAFCVEAPVPSFALGNRAKVFVVEALARDEAKKKKKFLIVKYIFIC